MSLPLFSLVFVLASAPSEADVRSQARDLLSDRSVQKELPARRVKKGTTGAQMPAGSTAPGQKRRLRRRSVRSQSQRTAFGSSFGQALMYVAIAVCLGLVLFLLLRGSLGYESDAPVTDSDDAGEDEGRDVVDRPLGDAEVLAARGLYADAVHTLLLETLMMLADRRGQPLPSSFTSREILARVLGAGPSHDALAEIIDVVEISHFGDVPIGQDEYQRCKDSYARFSSAFLSRPGQAAGVGGTA